MNLGLLLLTATIWGTTWLGIKYQLGVVHPLWSLTYRFTISAFILIIMCLLEGKSLKFSRKEHGWIAIQACFLFSINYLLCYYGSTYFVSGVVAVLFASITLMNIVNGRLFFKIPISASTLIGAITGVLGLILIFSTEVIRLWHQDVKFIFLGLVFCLGGTLCASFGQTVASGNIKRSMPIMQTNALGMAYGAIITMVIALLLGIQPTIEVTPLYLGSLIYLSIFGTVLAFGTYLTLVGNIGAAKASYTFVLIPLIALIVSSVFEEFDWDVYSFVGVLMVLAGNIIILARPRLNVEAIA